MISQMHEEYENGEVTYRGLIFFYTGLVLFGVGHCHGMPSGGLSRWRANGWNMRRQGQWTWLHVDVLSGTSTVWVIKMGVPFTNRCCPDRPDSRLTISRPILLLENSAVPHEHDRTFAYSLDRVCQKRIRSHSPLGCRTRLFMGGERSIY